MISIDNYDFKGKRAIIRVDFNVPLNEKGEVTDDTRIRAAMPTVKKVLAEGGAVILMSHMGRPKKNPDPKYSLEQIIPAIEKNLGVKVQFAGDCMGDKAAEMCRDIKPGEVVLLENLRFYAEEEGKPRGLAEDATKEEKDAAKKALKEGPQKEFVKKLASYADCYINDAFGTAHRKHASTYLIAKHFPNDKMFGYLMEKEVKAISSLMEAPQHPFCAIIGGSKVSTKIGVIKSLIEKVDSIVIGGGMTYTFAAAQGGKVGGSICEPDMFPVALEILELAKQKGVQLVMSPDALIADAFSADANTSTAPANDIPDGWEGVDIADEGKKIPTIFPTDGRVSTSPMRARRSSASTSSAARRSCGTAPWASSRSTSSQPVRRRWHWPSPRPRRRAPTRSSAAATRWPASTSSVWPTRYPTSRPAAAPCSNTSNSARCPVWTPSANKPGKPEQPFPKRGLPELRESPLPIKTRTQ